MIQTASAPRPAPTLDRAAPHDVVKLAHERLRQSPFLALRDVNCHFYDGVLTLTGEVPTFYTKQMAQTLVRDVDQVRQIENRLFVNY